MLTLVELQPNHIASIEQSVPGGARNIQDIYPLAPLQEGILFHHLLNERSDTYVQPSLIKFDSRRSLDALLDAFQAVIDRHDVLRSAVLWRDLPRPVQVVYRSARLPVEEIALDPTLDARAQMQERMAPSRLRMEIQRAPLVNIQIAQDVRSSAWYALVLQHHIMIDHVGLDVVLSEVNARLAGRTDDMSPPASYREFIARALERAASPDDAIEFFKAKFGDVSEPTTPFGLTQVHGDGTQIQEFQLSLDAELARGLRAQARTVGVSAAALFHAAWAVVVGRCSAKDDVVFGSVLLGRMEGGAELQRVLGMFINTLPVRFDLATCSVGELVRNTHNELIDLLKYEQTPLAVAQRCSGIKGAAPLFSAVLNYRHSVRADATTAPAGEDIGIRVLAMQERTNYPFTLTVDDLGENFALTAQTDRRVDPKRVANYVMEALNALLTALRLEPATAVSDLQIVPSDEQKMLIGSLNRPYQPVDCNLVHDLFAAQAATTPNALAVTYETQQLTYAELDSKANQLAHHLRRHAVGPDQLVGICVERGPEMVVALLAVLKAGGAYVPVDPAYPIQRMHFMLEDSSPRVLLTQGHLKERLPPTAAHVIALDQDWDHIAAESTSEPAAVGLAGHHLAYVIYTSGSTGQPKGVMVRHSGLTNFLRSMQIEPGMTSNDRLLALTTLSFDIAALEIYLPLICGGTLVMVSQETATDGTRLAKIIEEQSITVLQATPAGWRLLLDAGWTGRAGLKALCGGEALSTALSTRLSACVAELWNMYGPTETTIWSSVRRISAGETTEESSERLGPAIRNSRIYVLDERCQLVPFGVQGEIYIAGDGVARGYLNRPDLTEQRFKADPFSDDPSVRMYRTGDLARWRTDGTIEYLGRNDHQVKIRGFRIELGEIESQLSRDSLVKDAAVVARKDQFGDSQVIAYVVANEGKSVEPQEIRSRLADALPPYMIPAVFVVLDQLPLTPNGKIDRNALPAPRLSDFNHRYVAPRTPIEMALATLWGEVLKVDSVGIHDNFFERGGHSLLAMQLLVKVREQFGVELPLPRLIQTPTIAAMSETIEKTDPANDATLADDLSQPIVEEFEVGTL
jgi:amino acid adenylation domain-containing protein